MVLTVSKLILNSNELSCFRLEPAEPSTTVSQTEVTTLDSPTAVDVPPPLVNNVDIKKPQKTNNKTVKDPRLISDKWVNTSCAFEAKNA